MMITPQNSEPTVVVHNPPQLTEPPPPAAKVDTSTDFSPVLESINPEYRAKCALMLPFVKMAPVNFSDDGSFQIFYETEPSAAGSSLIALLEYLFEPAKPQQSRPYDAIRFLNELRRVGAPLSLMDQDKVRLLRFTPEGAALTVPVAVEQEKPVNPVPPRAPTPAPAPKRKKSLSTEISWERLF